MGADQKGKVNLLTHDLPTTAPCEWAGEILDFRYLIPRIWTQQTSRSFGIYWSDELSYGRLWPVPTEEELNRFYDLPRYHAYMSNTQQSKGTRWSLASKLAFKVAWWNDRGITDPIPSIMQLVSTSKPSLCDLGCGGGQFLSKMMNLGARPLGVDPSLASQKTVLSLGIKFYLGTAEKLPAELKERRFDLVTLFHSLEHCHNPGLALSNAVSLLKQDGLLVLDVPNLDSPGFRKYRQVWWHTDAGRHLHFFTQRSLEKLLSKAGVRPVKWEFCGFAHQFTPEYIEAMSICWRKMFGETGKNISPPRPSLLQSIGYMPKALVSEKSKKYDIVRVFCRRN